MGDNHLIIPPRLKKGACIGLFSPAGPVRDQERVNAGINLLHELGFQTRQYPATDHDHEYLAANDRCRTDEFHKMLADSEIDVMMAVRGGFGCMRIIKDIDLDQVRAAAKLLVGFSDITVLLNCISHRTGLVTLHGPVVSSLAYSSRDSVRVFIDFLTGKHPRYNEYGEIEILKNGDAEGILRGGNLTTLAHLIGTPWEISWSGSLLFIEDTGEPMYKIDRILTQLYQAGKLNNLSGLILGSFDAGEDTLKNRRLQEKVWQRTLELTQDFTYPVWGGFPSGHGHRNYSLPIGMPATINSSTAKLILHNLL